MKWKSVHASQMPIQMIKTNDSTVDNQHWLNAVYIEFNECDFTISTNNHNIVGSLFVDRVYFGVRARWRACVYNFPFGMRESEGWVCVRFRSRLLCTIFSIQVLFIRLHTNDGNVDKDDDDNDQRILLVLLSSRNGC